MPPKIKTTKEDIIKTAFSIVRERGIECLNARDLAKEMGISTQPIFSNFKNMEEVKDKVRERALNLYYERLKEAEEKEKEKKMKARGLAYISFAKEEGHLFSLLFMAKRDDASFPLEASRRELYLIKKKTDLADESVILMEKALFFLVHGIATNIITNTVVLDDSEIDQILELSFLSIAERLKNAE